MLLQPKKDKTMTRKEEIAQAFREIDRKYHYDALAPACLDMAEWADKTMIEKVCQWLEDNIDKEQVICHEQTWQWHKRDEFIKKLKQAMEE